MSGPTTVPCGLYVHVPFCMAKCGYCDFYSVAVGGAGTAGVPGRLVRELRWRLDASGAGLASVFVGGGTPTVLGPPDLAALLEPLGEAARAPSCREFTVEANPGTLSAETAGTLAAAGVTRLSLGAQSFQPDELASLDRLHRPGDVAAAVAAARKAGIEDLSLDLIYGIPGQTMATWCDSLDRAIDLRPAHLSLYALTYEPETPLTETRNQGQLTPCDEQLEADMYMAAVERVARDGFEQYEISNFSRPGCRCRHNLAYWNLQPHIGVGPSAVGFIDGLRYRNVPDVERYVEMIDDSGQAVVETERVEGRRLAGELAMLQLRLVEGIPLAEFKQRTGLDPARVFADTTSRYDGLGMLTASPTHIALTNRGRLYADTIIADLMAELDREADSVSPLQNGTRA